MASTAWKTREASEKQTAFIQKLADEKAIGGLEESIQEKIADVASGQSITGGEASEIIDALLKAPRKAKPSAGFAPLTSDYAERKAKAAKAQAKYEALTAAQEAAVAAAGGKAQSLGLCVTCGHSDHSGKEVCGIGRWMHLGHDSDYYTECSCKEFIEATALHEAARVAGLGIYQASKEASEAEYAAQEIQRGDYVVVARGRKVAKGSKGQVAKVSQGNYGPSAFLILEDGSKVWTALSNIEHQEG